MKVRLDLLVYRRGLAESREKARRLILAGQVLVNGRISDKAGAPIPEKAVIEVRTPPPFVSRGGYKLVKALDTFGIDPSGWIVADVGASTGGFTDVLLQRGAERVYAVDVGYGQLHWKLRQDARIVVMERTNARYLERLDEPVHLVTIDVSFISLELILPAVRGWLLPGGQVVALIKPQFEAGRRQVGKGGVVRDHRTHRQVLHRVITFATDRGWRFWGLTISPLKGPKGNIEFLMWLGTDATHPSCDSSAVIAQALLDAL